MEDPTLAHPITAQDMEDMDTGRESCYISWILTMDVMT